VEHALPYRQLRATQAGRRVVRPLPLPLPLPFVLPALLLLQPCPPVHACVDRLCLRGLRRSRGGAEVSVIHALGGPDGAGLGASAGGAAKARAKFDPAALADAAGEATGTMASAPNMSAMSGSALAGGAGGGGEVVVVVVVVVAMMVVDVFGIRLRRPRGFPRGERPGSRCCL